MTKERAQERRRLSPRDEKISDKHKREHRSGMSYDEECEVWSHALLVLVKLSSGGVQLSKICYALIDRISSNT